VGILNLEATLNMNNQQEFSPREAVERIFSRWWIIVILMVLGGLGGWTYHHFRSPVYEAKADLVISMDFSKRALTQYEEDYAFGTVGALILSDAVRGQVITKVQAEGIQINLEQFAGESFLEGRQSVWEMRVRNADPHVAATLVNAWTETAYLSLTQALAHAVKAEQLQAQVSGWQACLPTYVTPTPVPEQPSPYTFAWNENCKNYSLTDIDNALSELAPELSTEISQSQGLISILQFALPETAAVPNRPVIYSQAKLVLAGAAIGLVIALWMASLKLKK
jgi:hypothetical protein